jgi:hypothetical protein
MWTEWNSVRFLVLISVSMTTTVSCDTAPCSLMAINWHIRGAYCLHLQSKLFLPFSSIAERNIFNWIKLAWIMALVSVVRNSSWKGYTLIMFWPPCPMAMAYSPSEGQKSRVASLLWGRWSGRFQLTLWLPWGSHMGDVPQYEKTYNK